MGNPTDEQLRELARLIEQTSDCEIDCDEMLQRVAPYLHTLAEQRPLSEVLQPVTQHLKVCAECREEFDVLFRAEGIDPAQL